MLEIIVKIILNHSSIGRKVTLGKRVDVHIIISAEKIIDLLVIFSLVPPESHTTGKGKELCRLIFHMSAEAYIILIDATFLNDIFRATKTGRIKIIVVHIIEAVPVKMSILRDILLPCIQSPRIFLIIRPVIIRVLHIVVTWKISVIVRTWVSCIIPVHGSVTILTGSPQQSHRCLYSILCITIFEESDRLECLAYTGIAHLAVLITPVAVVHVVTHHIINLLGRCILSASLTGSSKSDETQAMTLAEFLLDTGIVCEITVVNTFHPVIATDTCRHIERI